MALSLNDLANQVTDAVTRNSAGNGNTEELATGINSALTNWFRTNLFPLMVGVAVFITVLFVFYGSFLYFTAYGDENRATQAKKTITYAFVGFFIAAVALGIANYTKRILISNQYETSVLNQTNGIGPAQPPGSAAPGGAPARVGTSDGSSSISGQNIDTQLQQYPPN